MDPSLRPLYAPVAEPLDEVERLVAASLASDQPLFAEVGAHLRGRGGKYLRAALLLLSAEATGRAATRATAAGAACEIIHLASLVHDDVIDGAEQRRGVASVNGAFGNRVAILFGDALYCRAFLLLPEAGKLGILEELLEAALAMCDGQALELESARRDLRDLARHQATIERKTAALFERAMRIGALVGGASPADRDRLGAYGRAFGLAFQMTDDLLDLTADEATLGKPVLSDLREGHYTQAVLFALESGGELARELRELIAPERVEAAAERIRELLNRSGAFDRARAQAAAQAAQAAAALDALERIASPEAVDRLRDLALRTIARDR